MKEVKIIEGVVAEYKGRYWGEQYSDGHGTAYNFGSLNNAKISDPKYCTMATDMTWKPTKDRYNSEYDALQKAKLLKVKKTITIEIL